jgi:hypothetical protein
MGLIKLTLSTLSINLNWLKFPKHVLIISCLDSRYHWMAINYVLLVNEPSSFEVFKCLMVGESTLTIYYVVISFHKLVCNLGGKTKRKLEHANEIVRFQGLNCLQELICVFELEV